MSRHRGAILVGLILLGSLPALVNIEWSRSSSEQRQAATPKSIPSSMASRDRAHWEGADSGGLGSTIQWDAQTDRETPADEAETTATEFDCMIEPWEEISVRSPIIGRIDAIHVERADFIEKGQLLVELDADLALAELDLAAKRTGMTASIRAFEARQSLGAKRGKRAVELFSQNAMALDERDEILTGNDIAKYDLEDARDQHSLANLQLARERARYEQRRIRSPIRGIVANRLMSVGEVVDEDIVLELAQIDPLRVEVILPAIEFGNVRDGMKAAVIPEIQGDEVIVATVRVVDQIIDSASGTFGVELELPNPTHKIPGGLRCRVQFMETQAQPDEMAQAEPIQP